MCWRNVFTCLNAGRLSIISCFSLGQNRSILLQKRVVAYEVLKEIVFVRSWVSCIGLTFRNFPLFLAVLTIFSKPKVGPLYSRQSSFFLCNLLTQKENSSWYFSLNLRKKFSFWNLDLLDFCWLENRYLEEFS